MRRGMFGGRTAPAPYLAEILTNDGRLLRRVRGRTVEAVAEWARLQAGRLPEVRRRADRVEVYRTTGEPSAPPVAVLPIYAPPS